MAQKAGTPDMKEKAVSQAAPADKAAPNQGTTPTSASTAKPGPSAAPGSAAKPGPAPASGSAAASAAKPGPSAAPGSAAKPGPAPASGSAAASAANSGPSPAPGPAANPGATSAPNPAAAKNNLFREKSLERIENPEKLNDYLRVTNPGVWLVLAAVIVILAGACVWGIFGRITATSPVAVVTQDGKSICLVPQTAIEGVIENRVLTVDGDDYRLTPAVLEPEVISESTNVYTMLAGELSVGDIVFPVALEEKLPEDGIVAGTVVTEKISPVALFFGK